VAGFCGALLPFTAGGVSAPAAGPAAKPNKRIIAAQQNPMIRRLDTIASRRDEVDLNWCRRTQFEADSGKFGKQFAILK
jgi:hypothetical protein